MPYGRMTTVSKPSWMKDAPTTTSTSDSSTTPSPTVSRPWSARRAAANESKNDEETAATPAKSTEKPAPRFGIKKDAVTTAAAEPKKEANAKLQSREVKVPLKVEKTVPPPTILKKSELNTPTRDSKTPPSKSPTPSSLAKTPVSSAASSDRSSKSPSTLASSKTPTSSAYSSSKSPSKTPDYDEDEESSEEESSEEESSEEETDSDDDDFDFDELEDDTRYKAPTPPPTNTQFNLPQLRKVQPPAKTDQRTNSNAKAASPEPQFKKPELKKVVTRQKSESKIRERSKSPEAKFFKPKLRKVPSSLKAPALKEKLPTVELKRPPPKPEPETTKKATEQFPAKPSVLRAESNKRIPLPPPPPPPPPPRGLAPPPDFSKKPISMKHRETLEKLKSRPRRRPDWSEMMKEVEEIRTNKKLRHVQCNDRSSPIITCKSLTKVNGQYLFETEKKPNELDQLLHEIQSGVKLRPTKTNDRSRPVLDGLRQFRRQMTIEEQIQKSESRAVIAEEPGLPPIPSAICDDFDDIDKIRDDLQSTKQMLAHELRTREFHERENKRLQARVAALEAELAREQWNPLGNNENIMVPGEDVVLTNLKKECEESQKTAKILQNKFQEATNHLDRANKEIEDQKRIIMNLEKRLQIYEDGSNFNDTEKEGGGDFEPTRRQSEAQLAKESSPEAEVLSEEEAEEELTEEQMAERAERRLKREVAMLDTKLKKLKDKELNAKSDRRALRENMKKNQQLLRSENKKMKKLQKEVEKMAKMMQSVENEFNDDDDESKGEPEEDDEEEEEAEESEPESEESESEESESDTESLSEAEDAEDQKKKDNLEPRVKRHDARLNSLKKGNYMLEANAEHLKDELKELKEKCNALQADLDSVIDLC